MDSNAQLRSAKIFEVNDCLIDLALEEVVHDNKVIRPEPNVFKTLVYLIENRMHVVDLDEFRDSLWHDKETSEFEIVRNIVKARQALLEDNTKPLIKYDTDKQGYQFVGEVFELEIN